MKKEAFPITAALLIISLASLVSADITINKQPDGLYSLGDKIVLPMTVTTSAGIYDFLQVSLICDGKEQKLPKESVDIAANEAKKIEKSILLIKKFIGDLSGTCKLKSYFEDSPANYVFSDEFKLSKAVNITIQTEANEFNPGEQISVKGTAKKENGGDVNGFFEMTVSMNNDSDAKKYYETVNNGFFSLNFSMPKDSKAGQYLAKINVYEKDPLGEVSNTGFKDYNILIKQVPTSLEVVFDNSEVNPGENLKVKSVLHDQTGEKINSTTIMTVKNSANKILEQKEFPTDEFFEFPIKYNEPPSNWTVVALSSKISSESSFTIVSKEDAKISIINKTVIVTNMGNIPYNETLLVKIGNSSENIDVYLKVDEAKKYTLAAPDGSYDVVVVSGGEVRASGSVLLTGNSIGVNEVSAASLLTGSLAIWVFITLVMGFMAFMFFRKGYQKSFFGRIPLIGRKDSSEKQVQPKAIREMLPADNSDSETITNPKNKAELSLSLSGERQNVSAVCLKVKNYNEVSRDPSLTRELFDRISEIVIENKGFIYDNQGSLFFLLIPSITKTFKNERKAVEMADRIEKMLINHNKMFKQKVDFGISVNCGDMVTKKDPQSMKFMAFGSFTNLSKKIASLANNEIYLSDSVGKRLLSEIKADRMTIQGVEVYKVRELKEKKEEHQKFIRQFMKRIEGGNEKDKKE